MIVSKARREATRQTAARDRAVFLDRVMAAKNPVDVAGAFRIRAEEWSAVLKPTDPTQDWFAVEVARVTLKIDHADKVDRTFRDGLSIRAETCWDLDRRFEAETLARGISKRPGEVVVGLRRTVQGCDYLIERWAMLAHLADQNGKWDDSQVGMAFDLLGTPAEVRGDDPCFQLNDDGRVVNHPDGPAGFARLQLDSLRSLRSNLEPLDDFDRESTIADLNDSPTPDYRRSRRYEAALQSRLKWCLSQFKGERAAAAATPAPPRPKAVAPPIAPPPKVEVDEIFDDFDDLDDEPTDEEMVEWFRAEAAKAGFTDLDILVPTRAQRDQIRTGAGQQNLGRPPA